MKRASQLIENGIYGVAIGDALGVPYEFCQREKIAMNPCCGMIGFGTYDKPAGTWSDDTSMTLATLVGIAKQKSDSDYHAIMDEYFAWLNEGRYTIDGVFDVGRICMDAVFKYHRGIPPLECGGSGEFHNGNGSLMRIMPATVKAQISNPFLNWCAMFGKNLKILSPKEVADELVEKVKETLSQYQ